MLTPRAAQVDYVAGGATQNSIRVAQWMVRMPGSTAFVGCVGEDAYATAMRAAASADGVWTPYLGLLPPLLERAWALHVCAPIMWGRL